MGFSSCPSRGKRSTKKVVDCVGIPTVKLSAEKWNATLFGGSGGGGRMNDEAYKG